MKFDLVHEPWVPVQRDGRQTPVCLREALVEAHAIDDLAPPRPTMVPALLRQVLLPVVIDAIGIPRSETDWASRWRAGQLNAAAIDDYLERHRDRFDLFHSTQPFVQAGELETEKEETDSSALLIPSVASGNNVPLFSARLETEPPDLSPAEATLWLLHTHCWDTAGIKSGAKGDPQSKKGRVYGSRTGPLGEFEVVIPLGTSLFETLLLNTPIIPDGLPPADRPQWRDDPVGSAWEERPPCGLLDLLTWQSRRIRLFPSEGGHGPVVREVIVCAGDRLVPDPDLEPHAAWRLDPKPRAGQPARRGQRPRAGRNTWQGLDTLLALEPPEDGRSEASRLIKQAGDLYDVLGEDYPLRVLTTGTLYGNQSAVVEHVVADLTPIPMAALRQEQAAWELLNRIVSQTETLTRALNRLDGELRQARGGDPVPWNRGQRPEVELVPRLDLHVRRLLTGLQGEPHREEEAAWAWEASAERIVWELADRFLDAIDPKAFAGRIDAERNRIHRPANAEAWFRRQVNEALPHRNRIPDSLEEAS